MMSNAEKIYVKMDRSAQVSKPLNTFKPGTLDSFSLSRKNNLFEFGYST